MRQTIVDSEMLNLARRWAPYGGVPASEIWITFGMGPERFFAHLIRILGTLTARELSPDQRQSLQYLAKRHVRGPYPPAGAASIGEKTRR